MSTNLYYKFRVNQKVFYYDTATLSLKPGTVIQVLVDAFIQNRTQTTAVSYIIRTSTGGTNKVEENLVFTDSAGNAPINANYSVAVKFLPGETVWVANLERKTVQSGILHHIEIKKYSTYDVKVYWVNYSGIDCSVIPHTSGIPEQESDMFDSADEALAYVGIIVVPTPTPGVSSTPVPTPTMTVTPTITPTLTMTVTPTPTPSHTPAPTPTPTSSPIPIEERAGLTVSKLNNTGQILYKGMVVSIDPITGQIVKANSSEASKALHFLGFVYDLIIPTNAWGRVILEGTINNTSTAWTDITTESGSLQTGRKYYLSSQDGKISFTPATSGYVKQVGFAVSSETLDIRIGPTIKL